jgi:hypothetical protein
MDNASQEVERSREKSRLTKSDKMSLMIEDTSRRKGGGRGSSFLQREHKWMTSNNNFHLKKLL